MNNVMPDFTEMHREYLKNCYRSFKGHLANRNGVGNAVGRFITSFGLRKIEHIFLTPMPWGELLRSMFYSVKEVQGFLTRELPRVKKEDGVTKIELSNWEEGIYRVLQDQSLRQVSERIPYRSGKLCDQEVKDTIDREHSNVEFQLRHYGPERMFFRTGTDLKTMEELWAECKRGNKEDLKTGKVRMGGVWHKDALYLLLNLLEAEVKGSKKDDGISFHIAMCYQKHHWFLVVPILDYKNKEVKTVLYVNDVVSKNSFRQCVDSIEDGKSMPRRHFVDCSIDVHGPAKNPVDHNCGIYAVTMAVALVGVFDEKYKELAKLQEAFYGDPKEYKELNSFDPISEFQTRVSVGLKSGLPMYYYKSGARTWTYYRRPQGEIESYHARTRWQIGNTDLKKRFEQAQAFIEKELEVEETKKGNKRARGGRTDGAKRVKLTDDS